MCKRLAVFVTVVLVSALAAALPVADAAAPAPGTVQSLTYGSGSSAHPYLVYTPRGFRPGKRLPLLVMLHGCQTTADQQMRANLYNPLADRVGFVVVYPDTDAVENAQPGPLARCWQFYRPQDAQRGRDDGAAVAAITHAVMAGWAIDSQRVYVMGMSAGSFLSADLAAEYPDLYAASGENAGGAYADGTCLFTDNTSLPVGTSARLAWQQMGPRARVVPRIVIGGDADQGVPPACADKALLQGLRTDNLVIDGNQTSPIALDPASVTPGQVPGGDSYTVADYRDQHGCLLGQRVLVHGMNHFWSGGSADPTLKDFTDPRGPSAALLSWAFFSRFTLAGTARPCATVPGLAPGQPLPRPGCPAQRERLAETALGPARLGMSQARVRRALAGSTRRLRHGMDFFCLRPAGIRVGYARETAVLLLTADRSSRLRGIQPGEALATAARRVALTGPFRVGLNAWYLLSNGRSRGVLKVRHGRVEEVGIANRSLTSDRQRDRRFLRSFNG